MKKMFINMGCIVLFTICMATNTMAEGNSYYVNDYGVEFTETEYNTLLDIVDESAIRVLEPELAAEILTNIDQLETTEYEINTIITESVDDEGKVTCTESLLTTNELYDILNNRGMIMYNLSSRNDSYTTSMKRITMSMTQVNASAKWVTITAEWLSMPTTRSYDIIAVRVADKCVQFLSEISNVTGTQETNVGTTNYTYASSNTKILSNGVGISMDLYNNATTKIKCTMQCKFGSGADPFTVFGTYQHATSDLSLSDSQKYKLAVGGMGDVLEFTSSSVKAKYDNTSGLCVTGSINDQ